MILRWGCQHAGVDGASAPMLLAAVGGRHGVDGGRRTVAVIALRFSPASGAPLGRQLKPGPGDTLR